MRDQWVFGYQYAHVLTITGYIKSLAVDSGFVVSVTRVTQSHFVRSQIYDGYMNKYAQRSINMRAKYNLSRYCECRIVF